jgi:hypothetical protein
MHKASILAAMALIGAASLALGSVHVVEPDGSGSYPSIQLAVNAVAPGDTILLADGVFQGAGNRDISLARAIVILSQSGQAPQCIIDCQGSSSSPHRGFIITGGSTSGATLGGVTIENAYLGNGSGGAIYCYNGASPTIQDCILQSNSALGSATGAAMACEYAWPHILRCTFWNNVSSQRSIVRVAGASPPYIPSFESCSFAHNSCTASSSEACAIFVQSASVALSQTIIAFTTNGFGLYFGGGGTISGITCCDFYGNDLGNWVGPAAGQLGINGNIQLDPLFCDPFSPELYISAASPCYPSNPPNPECDLIGAWPETPLPPPPVAVASASPPEVLEGCAGETFGNVYFNHGSSSSEVCGADIIAYNWDFDASDGLWWDTSADPDYTTADPLSTPVHRYLLAGDYTATLQIVDGLLLSDTNAVQIRVLTMPNDAPMADAGGPYEIEAGEDLQLTGSASDINEPCGDTLSFFWDLDDNGSFDFTGSTPLVPWAFLANLATDTPLPVLLRVIDSEGLNDEDTTTLTIDTLSPVAAAAPACFALHGNYPNPFNPATVIAFDLPTAADVTVTVYTLAGRLLVTLLQERRAAGRHEVIWRGLDAIGRPIPSGVYFYRIQAGTEVGTDRLTLIR